MVAVPSNCNKSNFELVKQSFTKNKVGAAILLGEGTLKKQNELINELQKNSKIKLFIAKDLEPGFFRFLDLMEFPKNRTLGSAKDDLVFELAQEVGNICNQVGVNINFAPVVDVSCNPKNPVIRARAFGTDKFTVAKKGIAFSKGLQSQNVISCAKHFPGHGDTQTDSHLDLPIIKHSKSRLEKIELYPFKELINNGVDAVMLAHLQVLSLDKKDPASLSKKIVDELKNNLNFKGLIVTDALNMKGITKNYSQAQAAVKALQAGVDIVLIARPKAGFIDANDQDDYKDLYLKILPETFNAIKNALKEGVLTEEEIDKKIEKILKYKTKFCKNSNLKDQDIKELNDDVLILKNKIFKDAIKKVGAFKLGKKILNLQVFGSKTPLFENVDSKMLSEFLLKDLKNYSQVVLEVFNVNVFGKNYDFSNSDLEKIKRLEDRKKLIVVIYGLPVIEEIFDKKTPKIFAHENDDVARKVVKETIVLSNGFLSTPL